MGNNDNFLYNLILVGLIVYGNHLLSNKIEEQKSILNNIKKSISVQYFDKNIIGDPSKNEHFYVIGKDTAFMKIDGVDISDKLK